MTVRKRRFLERQKKEETEIERHDIPWVWAAILIAVGVVALVTLYVI